MEAYKFRTKVSEDGTIIIPDEANLNNREVEVIILNQETISPTSKKMTGKTFVQKYSGFLKGVDPDKAKSDYFKEKYNL